MAKTNGNGAAVALANLEKQAEALRGELVKMGGQRVSVADLEANTARHARRLALEEALRSVDMELVAARAAAAEEQAVTQAAELAERNTAARAALEMATAAAWAAVQRTLGDLDAVVRALAEYRAVGGYAWRPAVMVAGLTLSVAQAERNLRGDAEGRRLLGLPRQDSPQEVALAEAQAMVAQCNHWLAEARKLPSGRDGNGRRAALTMRHEDLWRARRRLAQLTGGKEPTRTDLDAAIANELRYQPYVSESYAEETA